MNESSILYEKGDYFVLKARYGYEVCQNKGTHSLRWAVIRLSLKDARQRAIAECEKRAS